MCHINDLIIARIDPFSSTTQSKSRFKTHCPHHLQFHSHTLNENITGCPHLWLGHSWNCKIRIKSLVGEDPCCLPRVLSTVWRLSFSSPLSPSPHAYGNPFALRNRRCVHFLTPTPETLPEEAEEEEEEVEDAPATRRRCRLMC